jgi:prepilin-type processing-associated H-X9-DG protein
LAVLAVIATLAAILIPAVQNMTRRSLLAKGTGTLRALAQAQLLYAGEHNNRFTPRWQAAGDLTWQATLMPYLGIDHDQNDGTFVKRLRMDPDSVFNVPDSTPLSERASWATSLGLNPWMPDIGSPNHPARWIESLPAIPNPAQTILLGEMPYDMNGEGTWPPDWRSRSYDSFNRNGRTQMLVAFCDGHVGAFELEYLYDSRARRPAGAPNLWHWWYQPGIGASDWQ